MSTSQILYKSGLLFLVIALLITAEWTSLAAQDADMVDEILVEGLSNWKMQPMPDKEKKMAMAKRIAKTKIARRMVEFQQGIVFTYEVADGKFDTTTLKSEGVINRKQVKDLGCKSFDSGLFVCQQVFTRQVSQKVKEGISIHEVTGIAPKSGEIRDNVVRAAYVDAYVKAIKEAAKVKYQGTAPKTIKGILYEVKTVSDRVDSGNYSVTLLVKIILGVTAL